MKLFKRAMALVLAGVMAVGAFTVTTASVKADEAVAEEYTIDENSAFRTDDVTKIKFKKEFADDTIHFYRQFNSSLSQLMIDMKKIQAEAEGVSWLHNIEVVLTDLEGNVYTLKYKGSGDISYGVQIWIDGYTVIKDEPEPADGSPDDYLFDIDSFCKSQEIEIGKKDPDDSGLPF